ncbi:hypothetical protein N9Y60_01900 [Crocinitomicaceae bacterium]|nr:hypothetical protein [Crocinitomicaceae bacterium]
MYWVEKPLVLFFFVLLSVSTVRASNADSTLSNVEVESFEVRLSSRVIHVQFVVASEKAGKTFLVEKSLDKEVWNPVTSFTSIGDHNSSNSYETSIIDFPEGVLEHYRLIRVDLFEDTVVLDSAIIRRKSLKNMQLIPVEGKAHKEVNITYDSMVSSEGFLTVMSRSGEIVEEIEISIASGYNRFKLRIKDYEKGDYLVTVLDQNDNKISKRLVVYK